MNFRNMACAITLAAFAAAPSTVRAQCGMGHTMGSAHDHGTKETAKETTKHDKEIQKLLADKGARARLFDVIAGDDSWFRELLVRGFETDRGRRMGIEAIHQAGVGASSGRPAGDAEQDSAAVTVEVYRCPMHPEVVSSSGGSCPECGMALERVKSPSDP